VSVSTSDASDRAPPPPVAAHRHPHRFTSDAIGVAGVAIAVATATAGAGGHGWRQLRVVLLLALTALAAEAARRASTRAAGALAAAAGVLGVVAGVGIGVPHLAKTGATLAAVSGAFALVTGLALVVASGVLLVGSARWWWRAVAVPLAAVVLLVAVSVGAPPLLATNVPPTTLGPATPSERGVAFTTVALRTADGVRLAGWYVPSSNGAAVVVRHGAGSTRSGVLDHVVVLSRAGYGVLALDARGHGESEGRAMDFGWFGDLDIAAGLDFLAAQPTIDRLRIGVVGLSMGGEEALGAAATDADIRAVVAEGATARTDADKAWLSDEYGVRGWVQERLEWAQYTLTDALTDAGKPTALRDGVARGLPVLLVAAGTMDDEVHVARELHEAAPTTVETWIVDGAGHTDGLDVAPEEWTRRVVTFLDRALLDH